MRRNPRRVRYWHSETGSTIATPARPPPTSSDPPPAPLPPPRAHDPGPANDAANLIAARSPISVSVALEAVRRAAKLDTLEDVLRQEYRPSSGPPRPPALA